MQKTILLMLAASATLVVTSATANAQPLSDSANEEKPNSGFSLPVNSVTEGSSSPAQESNANSTQQASQSEARRGSPLLLNASVTRIGRTASDQGVINQQTGAEDLQPSSVLRAHANEQNDVSTANITDNGLIRMVLVLDCSGSELLSLGRGQTQALLNRLCPLIMKLSGKDTIDCWAYADRAEELPKVTTSNLWTYINDNICAPTVSTPVPTPPRHSVLPKISLLPRFHLPISRIIHPNRFAPIYSCPWMRVRVGGGNLEGVMMRTIMARYSRDGLPTEVIIVTDGGVDQKGISDMLVESAQQPILWTFVGFNPSSSPVSLPQYFGTGSATSPGFPGHYPFPAPGILRGVSCAPMPGAYSFLEGACTVSGRMMTNASIVPLDDFVLLDDKAMTNRLMAPVPAWEMRLSAMHVR